MTILVTGSAGMIGSNLVKGLIENGFDVIGIDKKPIEFDNHYKHFEVDLGDKEALDTIFSNAKIDRVIHLAALAHTMDGKKYPKSMYEFLNVECANNVFGASAKHNTPVLFISTVDVFGFQKGIVNSETICHPVTIYGKTKLKAEELLKNSGAAYSIFRFSPVYTSEIKRDIQKRYYLKYPKWAYLIGRGSFYEVLSIDNAVREMINWCSSVPSCDIRIIKDKQLLDTRECIKSEKAFGNAKHVLKFPRWFVCFGYYVLRITGKNKYTFLLNKAVHPLKSQ